MAYEQLKIENQLCFPLYSATRLIIREYTKVLTPFGLTYTQYLVLLVLWERDDQGVNEIAETLNLQTNTITPLLKRMAKDGWVTRARSTADERKVMIKLTRKAKDLEKIASDIPMKLKACLPADMTMEQIVALKEQLNTIIATLGSTQATAQDDETLTA